ncbi:MAG: AtpZ/AtpI family protein [Terracidiphilus sp.]|jgi:hypothetical protein
MPFNSPIPDSTPPGKGSGGLASLIQAEKLMQIAILLPSAAFVGWLAGAWLDSRLHQGWIATLGIVFGGISGLVYVVRLAMAAGVKNSGSLGQGNQSGTGKGSSGVEP